MDFSFSDDFLKALDFSRDEAVRTGWHNICPDHIMLGIIRHADNDACAAMEAAGLDVHLLKSLIDEAIFVSEQLPWEERDSVYLCDSATSLLESASLEAMRCGSDEITPLHFLLALSRKSGSYTSDYLDDAGIDLRALVTASGMHWEAYGLGRAREAMARQSEAMTRQSEPPAPDPARMAEAIERLLVGGYTTDNPLVS